MGDPVSTNNLFLTSDSSSVKFNERDVRRVRKSIENILQLRCIFPAMDAYEILPRKNSQWQARCMQEFNESKWDSSNNFIEDVMVKIRFLESDDPVRLKFLKTTMCLLQMIFKSGKIPSVIPASLPPVSCSSNSPDSYLKEGLFPAIHPGLCQVIDMKVTEDEAVLVHAFSKHTLLSVSRFHTNSTLSTGTLSNTTGLGCKDLRLRFILFQLLQAMCFLHEKNLCMESLTTSSIMLDDDMWLYLPLGLSDRVLNLCSKIDKSNSLAFQNNQIICREIPRPIGYYEPLMLQWISGKLSNFEYLMAINFAVGRTMIDPLYHPIMPWVTDFTTDCLDACEPPSWRDLKMTKFRLSKGDTQLETTYKHSDPPHHIPESLSELTYYIYMARRTPMQVLRRVVRDVFVPEHYPQSMNRIYEWTPDECIPEFYFDCSFIESIHKKHGLQDLELPPFVSDASDFIKYHRAVLESDFVSSQLHIWIDLTFGYCLQGDAAISHMNVPLCHALNSAERIGLDSPNLNKNPGFVMLFDYPHPKRQVLNKKVSSHIYSYNNTLQVDDEFISLNTKYAVDSSSKYSKPDKSCHVLSGLLMSEYSKLDQPSYRSKQHQNSITGSIRGQSSLSTKDPAIGSNPTKDSAAANLMQEDSAKLQSKKPKKSLSNPIVDSSLAKLKQLENISLSSDMRYVSCADNFSSQTQHYRFTQRLGVCLDAVYSYDIDEDEPSDRLPVKGYFEDINIWDKEFTEALNKYSSLLDSVEPNISKLPILEDLLLVGCAAGELYSGRSLLQKNDAIYIKENCSRSYNALVSIIYRKTTGLPLVLRRLITLLLHPNPNVRPAAREILTSCSLTPMDLGPEGRSEKSTEKVRSNNTTHSSSREQLLRMEFLTDYCGSLFPAYFRRVYGLVGSIKLSQDRADRLQALIGRSEEVHMLPLEGLNLALVHVLDVIGDPSCFNEKDASESRDSQLSLLASKYWSIIDAVGVRIGPEATEKLLVPQVIKFLNNFQNAKYLPDLLYSSLWSVLIHRAGVRPFLRSFLPYLLTYISSGVLQNILEKGISLPTTDAIPVWSLPEWSGRSHWLRKCSINDLQHVQHSAIQAVIKLCEADSLGKGIAARYIVPSLLSLVGIPQLASSGSEVTEADATALAFAKKAYGGLDIENAASRNTLTTGDRPELEDLAALVIDDDVSNPPPMSPSLSGAENVENERQLERFLQQKSVLNATELYVVNTLVGCGIKLGEVAISELILAHIFNITLPELESQLTSTPKHGTAAAFLEIIVLINGLLPTMSPNIVLQDLLQPARLSGCSLPKLLSLWPLTTVWSFLDDATELVVTRTSMATSIENIRMYTVLQELCRLIVSCCMLVGVEECSEYVLPFIDIYYNNFVNSYGMAPVESKMMMKAFEVASELYLPLENMMGAEWFQTSVPNLNPRLAMWLQAIGSQIPPRSPPLPSNIWPEVTTESTNQPEKRKGLMQWISGKSKWMSSLTSSSTAAGPSAHSGASSSTPFSPIPSSYNQRTPAKSTSLVAQELASHLYGTDTMLESTKKSARKTRIESLDSRIDEQNSSKVPYSTLLANAARTPLSKGPHSIISPTNGTELISMEAEPLVARGIPIKPLVEAVQVRPEVSKGQQKEPKEAEQDPDTASYGESDTESVDQLAPITIELEDPFINKGVENGFESPIAIANEVDTPSNQETVAAFSSPPTQPEPEPEPEAQEAEQEQGSTDAKLASIHELRKSILNMGGEEEYDLQKQLAAERKHPFITYRKLLIGRSNVSKTSRSAHSPGLSSSAGTSAAHGKNAKSSKMRITRPSILQSTDAESMEDVEARELYHSEHTWLLAGFGRWNVDREHFDRSHREQHKQSKANKAPGLMYYNNNSDWSPAAQMSMTAPKIAVDVAGDAGTVVNFQLSSNTQFRLEEPPGNIKCMVANPSESMLLTCSRTGVRLWSLSSHPLLHISSYTNHANTPFSAVFLRSGQHVITCDGSIHLWDIEYRSALGIITTSDKAFGFSSFSVVPSKFGVHASIDAMGDEQFLATTQDTIAFYDIRCSHSRSLFKVADWTIPQLPPPQFTLYNSSIEPLQLSCAVSHDNYVFAGSQTGGLWVIDRRMGRVLNSWQAFDGPVVKISSLNDKHFLAVSDRSAAVWEYSSDWTSSNSYANSTTLASSIAYPKQFSDPGTPHFQWKETSLAQTYRENRETPSGIHTGLGGIGDFKRVLNIRNVSDGTFSASSVLTAAYEPGAFPTYAASINNSGNGLKYTNLEKEILSMSTKPINALYCLSGHKMYSGILPTFDPVRGVLISPHFKEGVDTDDFKLTSSHFYDRKGVKLSKSKMQITSAALLPLRRLLLLGTEDGLVRVVS